MRWPDRRRLRAHEPGEGLHVRDEKSEEVEVRFIVNSLIASPGSTAFDSSSIVLLVLSPPFQRVVHGILEEALV
jgi:hypothetical protein